MAAPMPVTDTRRRDSLTEWFGHDIFEVGMFSNNAVRRAVEALADTEQRTSATLETDAMWNLLDVLTKLSTHFKRLADSPDTVKFRQLFPWETHLVTDALGEFNEVIGLDYPAVTDQSQLPDYVRAVSARLDHLMSAVLIPAMEHATNLEIDSVRDELLRLTSQLMAYGNCLVPADTFKRY